MSSAGSEPETKRPRVEDEGGEAHPDADAAAEHRSLPGRRCFVTIGATAGFRALLDEVSTPGFLQCLARHGYSALTVQCGPDYGWFTERVNNLSAEDKHGISISSFQYTDSMIWHILNCRGEANVRLAGCVISHAGSGTILEVLRVGAPLIVVANPTLMDNHQLELAEALEQQKSAVHGEIGNLPAAIARVSERIAQGTLDALPPHTAAPFPLPASDRVVLCDWMVLTCYPDECARQRHLRELAEVGDTTGTEAERSQQRQQDPTDSIGPAVAARRRPAHEQGGGEDDGRLRLD
ncbi:hypothetical protein VTK56DRAFT_3808 [Thermocarpiscus australiensis]